jgi:hypothetical protein
MALLLHSKAEHYTYKTLLRNSSKEAGLEIETSTNYEAPHMNKIITTYIFEIDCPHNFFILFVIVVLRYLHLETVRNYLLFITSV